MSMVQTSKSSVDTLTLSENNLELISRDLKFKHHKQPHISELVQPIFQDEQKIKDSDSSINPNQYEYDKNWREQVKVSFSNTDESLKGSVSFRNQNATSNDIFSDFRKIPKWSFRKNKQNTIGNTNLNPKLPVINIQSEEVAVTTNEARQEPDLKNCDMSKREVTNQFSFSTQMHTNHSGSQMINTTESQNTVSDASFIQKANFPPQTPEKVQKISTQFDNMNSAPGIDKSTQISPQAFCEQDYSRPLNHQEQRLPNRKNTEEMNNQSADFFEHIFNTISEHIKRSEYASEELTILIDQLPSQLLHCSDEEFFIQFLTRNLATRELTFQFLVFLATHPNFQTKILIEGPKELSFINFLLSRTKMTGSDRLVTFLQFLQKKFDTIVEVIEFKKSKSNFT